MKLRYNGVNKSPVPGPVRNTFRLSISDEDIQEDSSFENCFRGFQKVPEVLLRPLDITPYLRKKKIQDFGTKKAKIKTDGLSVNLEKFLGKCSVNVVREDLNKLKDSLCTNPENSDSIDLNMDLKCKICDKVYSSEKKLQNHQQNKHMIVYKSQSSKPQKRVTFSDNVIVHDLKKYHRCRKCPKIFKDYKSLKSHMKMQHKKRNCYICNYCTKEFVDRMFFKVHVRFHCDICGLLLPNKKKYSEHKRNVCRIIKFHPCKTCDGVFFRSMDLKDHSYEHITTCYVCDICKDRCQTKCALAHHISFLHSKRRPTALYTMRNLGTERLYLCNFCDESSVDRDLIECHVQTLPDLNNRAMTGYKDYYFCDQCFKKFETETEMLHHKWSHFLKTSDNSQLRSKDLDSAPEIKKEVRTTYKICEKLPDHFLPKVVLEKLDFDGRISTESMEIVDVESVDICNGDTKKSVVDPKSKKTILSKHQCQTCSKFFSTNYCLNRHIETQHSDYNSLRCKVCEETFYWPSLLMSHKCIRLNLPEMPFDDARPEIHFDNLHEITPNFDDLNITESDDYMNSIDFEIPAPIVEINDGNFGDRVPVSESNHVLNGQASVYGSSHYVPVLNGQDGPVRGSNFVPVLNGQTGSVHDSNYVPVNGQVVSVRGSNNYVPVLNRQTVSVRGSNNYVPVLNGQTVPVRGSNNYEPVVNGQPMSVIDNSKTFALQSLGYKIVQEVPIEF